MESCFIILFKRFPTLFLFPLIIVLVIIYCSLPSNPSDPSNTAISVVMKTSDGKIHSNSLADTVNKKFSIGAALRLPENFDSIRLTIIFKEDTIVDTMFSKYGKLNSYSDTIWTECTFFSPGIYYAIFTPATSLNLNAVTANVVMAEADVMPQNHKPVISVSGKTIFAPGETCVLTVLTFDADANQILTAATKGKPEGSVLKNNIFTWIIPVTFKGFDTVAFLVSDNGYPQESDTEIVVITVSSTSHAPLITISGDSILKPLETCTLTIHTSDRDSGQTLHVTMTGYPDGATLVNDSEYIWTAPNVDSAKHIVTFTVTDNGIPPQSTSANITLLVTSGGTVVNSAPKWSVDTLRHSMSTKGTYSLPLSGICSDTDKDKLKYTLLTGTPQGDTIIDSNYTFAATVSAAGAQFVNIVAADPQGAKDTLVIKLNIENSTVDTTAPEITFVSPENGNANTTTPSFIIDVICSDASGILSVAATFREEQLPAIYLNGHYTMTVIGLLPDTANTIVVIAKDSSVKVNSTSKSAIVVYKPTHTVTYDANTGIGTAPVDENKYKKGDSVLVKGEASLIKVDCTFKGWNTIVDGSGTAYAAGSVLTIGNKDLVLFAQWKNKPTFTVTYNANTGSGTAPTDANVYVDGSPVTVKGVEALTKDGFSFAGWSTLANGSGTSYAAAATLIIGAANVILYAKWSLIPTFTVTYNANTGTGTAPVDTNAYVEGASVTVKSVGVLTKDGYSFAGWNTLANGNGVSYAAAATLTIGAANVILYAKWAPIPTFTVTYNANTGSGTVPVDTNAYIEDAQVTVKGAGTLTKTDCDFAGWNTLANGSGSSYPAAATFSIGTANVTLYAKWKIKQYTLTVNTSGHGTVNPSGDVTVNVGEENTITATPMTGYEFNEWVASGGATIISKTSSTTKVKLTSGNATVTASFKAICYGYTFSCGTCGQWNFESNTVERWMVDNDPNTLNGDGSHNAVQSVAVTSSRVHSGSYAIAAPIYAVSTNGYLASIAVPICDGVNTINLAGFTLSTWVYFAGPQLDDLANVALVSRGPEASFDGPTEWGSRITPNTWTHIEVSYNGTIEANHLAILLRAEGEWTGTMYVDDILITGP